MGCTRAAWRSVAHGVPSYLQGGWVDGGVAAGRFHAAYPALYLLPRAWAVEYALRQNNSAPLHPPTNGGTVTNRG